MKRAADSQRLEHSIQKKQTLMELPQIHIGDEIIFLELSKSGRQEFKMGMWIVRSFDRSKGLESVVLQCHYNNWEMLEPERIIRPKKYIKKQLLEKLANKRRRRAAGSWEAGGRIVEGGRQDRRPGGAGGGRQDRRPGGAGSLAARGRRLAGS